MLLSRSRVSRFLIAGFVLASGCRATANLRIGRGIDHDLVDEEDDEAGDPGGAGEARPVGDESAPPAEPPGGESQPVGDPWTAASVEPPVAETGPMPRNLLHGRQLTSRGRQAVAAWSEDGSQILFQAVRGGGLVDNPWEQTWLMDADGTRQRRLTMGVGRTERPNFVPGRPHLVSYASTHHTGMTPAPDEQGAAAQLQADLDIYLQDLGEGSLTALTSSPGFDGDAAWCRDGARVAFSSARDGDVELYTMTIDGSDVRRITFRPGADVGVSWSPDCAQLAWSAQSPNGESAALVVAAADGSDAEAVLGGDARHERPAWMPRGEVLVFASNLASADGTMDLFALTLGGGLTRLTAASGNERDPIIAPDGTRLLYTSDRTGAAQLFMADMPPDAGTPWTLDR